MEKQQGWILLQDSFHPEWRIQSDSNRPTLNYIHDCSPSYKSQINQSHRPVQFSPIPINCLIIPHQPRETHQAVLTPNPAS